MLPALRFRCVEKLQGQFLQLFLIGIEFIELLCAADKKSMAYDGLRRIFILHVVKSVCTPEIRNAALGRYSGAAEKYKIIRIIDDLL